jgi:hypothetical protein
LLPSAAHDVRGLKALPLALRPGDEIYADAAYIDYHAEDNLFDTEAIRLQVARKAQFDSPGLPA